MSPTENQTDVLHACSFLCSSQGLMQNSCHTVRQSPSLQSTHQQTNAQVCTDGLSAGLRQHKRHSILPSLRHHTPHRPTPQHCLQLWSIMLPALFSPHRAKARPRHPRQATLQSRPGLLGPELCPVSLHNPPLSQACRLCGR